MAALYAESITSNLKFTAKVPLLMKATSNDEKPTQGYHLQEISRISKSSLPNCQSLLSFLLGRLEKKEPHIKFKVLHLMKYLVINGHSEFRSQLRHNADAVKQTVNYQGDLDAVHGDGLNMKVQQAASELEKLLFDVDNPEVDIIYKSMLAPSESNRKMQGFGHTRAPEIKKEPLFMNTLMKVKKSSTEIFNMNKSKTNTPPSDYEQRPNTPPPKYTPIELEDSEVQSAYSSVDDKYDEDSDDICEERDMDNDHYYERKLVDNVTAERGLTRIPSKEMLKDFVNKSSQLEISVILEILNERLENVSPIVQLKSLCVLEFLLRSNLLNIAREIHDHCPSIHLLGESQDATLQPKAKKILLAIASCLKQDEIQDVSRVVVPPGYNAATELPKMKAAKETESLFSGMSLSTGTRHDFAANRKSLETSQPLIDIEHTNPAENEKKATEKSNPSLLCFLQTNTETNQFFPVTDYGAHDFNLIGTEDFSTSLQNRDLPLLETRGLKSSPHSHESEQDKDQYFSDTVRSKTSTKSGDSALQNLDIANKNRLVEDIDKERLIFNSTNETTGRYTEHNNDINRCETRSGLAESNNFDLLNCQASRSRAVSSQNSENLLLLDSKEQNHNPLLPSGASHTNPNGTVQPIPQNANSHLLRFQPRSQTLPGGLVLPTNSSSSSPRRPLPKDMKSSGGFDFIRKSTKSDAFSFINDEIQANKTKQK